MAAANTTLCSHSWPWRVMYLATSPPPMEKPTSDTSRRLSSVSTPFRSSASVS
jgi:hypothetical protein